MTMTHDGASSIPPGRVARSEAHVKSGGAGSIMSGTLLATALCFVFGTERLRGLLGDRRQAAV